MQSSAMHCIASNAVHWFALHCMVLQQCFACLIGEADQSSKSQQQGYAVHCKQCTAWCCSAMHSKLCIALQGAAAAAYACMQRSCMHSSASAAGCCTAMHSKLCIALQGYAVHCKQCTAWCSTAVLFMNASEACIHSQHSCARLCNALQATHCMVLLCQASQAMLRIARCSSASVHELQRS